MKRIAKNIFHYWIKTFEAPNEMGAYFKMNETLPLLQTYRCLHFDQSCRWGYFFNKQVEYSIVNQLDKNDFSCG